MNDDGLEELQAYLDNTPSFLIDICDLMDAITLLFYHIDSEKRKNKALRDMVEALSKAVDMSQVRRILIQYGYGRWER